MKFIYSTIILFVLTYTFISCGSDDVDGITAQEYVAANDLEATELEDGVYISYVTTGTGLKPIVDDKINIAYKGYLAQDKSVFDSNEDATFLLRNLIRGWQIGIKEMPVGTEAILIIPPSQAYGSQTRTGIPANSTLVFEITLKDIVE